MLLPRKVGPFTLMRKVDADAMAESYVAILDAPAGKQVVARRLLSAVTRDPARMAQIRGRVADLRSARHPALAAVLELVETDGEAYVLEEQVEGAELRRVVDHCADHGLRIPHNVYLEIGVQLCNAMEALHSRPGIESGSENVLHLALAPSAIWIGPDGKVTLGRYGLTRSPTALAHQAAGLLPARVEYLAPEQTHQDQKLSPSSDLFALGAVLYELLALRPMFLADTQLQTIHRVRRAEVTTQLLEVKEILPGLDKVLFRSLSLNPRHRYQRAFVLREDLRALMAGYSFSDIAEATRGFLQPVLDALPPEDDGLFDATSDTTFGELAPFRESTQDLLGEVPDRRSYSDSPMGGPRRVTDSIGDDEGPYPDDTAALLDPGSSPRPSTDEEELGATGWASSGLDAPPVPPLSVEVDRSPDAPPAPAVVPGSHPGDPDAPDLDPEPEVPRAGSFPARQAVAPAPRRAPTPASVPEPERIPEADRIPVSEAPAGPALPVAGPPPASPPRPAPRRPSPGGPAPARAAIERRSKGWIWASLGVAGLAVAAALVVCVGGGGLLGLATLGPRATLGEPLAPPAAAAPVVLAPATPPRETFEAVIAAASSQTPELPPGDGLADAGVDVASAPVGDLAQVSDAAFQGRLEPEDRVALEALPPSDPRFTRAGTLLFLDARARGDAASRDRILASLLAVPENAGNPELLLERARIAADHRQWQPALSDAELVERHWARLPPDLLASRKTAVYEIQAVANEGLFHASQGADRPRLDAAIRGWERYRAHVGSLPEPALAARADHELARLREARERLE